MKTKILDLIDFEKVNTLLEGFNKSTGFVTAILDLDGKVLSQSGGRQICTGFHRINPETAKKCTISDTVLAGKLAEDKKYHFYKCLNGLVDVAVPLVLNGEHIANLFTGQFFFKEPDKSFFQKQANKYGFNENNYLNALVDVPIVSEEKAKKVMSFLLNMTELIINMTLQKMEQLKLIEAIQKSELKLKEAQQIAKIGNWELDLITNKLSWSDEVYRIFNLQLRQCEATYKAFLANIHPDDRDKVNQAYTESVINKTPYVIVHRLLLKDGIIKYVNEYGTTFYDDSGKAIRSIGTVQDITELKRVSMELESKSDLIETLIQTIPDLIWLKDTKGVFLKCNPIFELLYGTKESEIIGKTDYDFVDKELADFFREHDRKAQEANKPVTNEEFLIFADGSYKGWFETTKTPMFNKDGEIIGVLGIARDISDRKIAEEELKKHHQHLEELVKERTKEIEEKSKELERINNLFVGRELRMAELKKEIEDLKGTSTGSV
jgi:PAS domain S-box-containing protein